MRFASALVVCVAGAAWANPCTAAKIDSCAKACEAGNAKTCLALGSALKSGLGGVTPDPARSLVAYEKGCALGSAEACNSAGAAHVAAKNEAAGVALIERACKLKHAFACESIASIYETGAYGVTPDADRAIALRTAACDAGGKEACLGLARAYDEGKGVLIDKVKAHALFVKACSLQSGGGCYAMGIDQRDGEGTKVDGKAMLKSYEQACTLGFNPACTELALTLKTDPRKAFGFAKKACDSTTFPASFEACALAGEWARDGLGTKKDLGEAKRFADHGCLNKEPRSCALVEALTPK